MLISQGLHLYVFFYGSAKVFSFSDILFQINDVLKPLYYVVYRSFSLNFICLNCLLKTQTKHLTTYLRCRNFVCRFAVLQIGEKKY